MTVFLNGDFVPGAGARVPLADRGLQFGFGFFETFRTSGGRPHLWNHHRARLEGACKVAGIQPPAGFLVRDESRLRAVVRQLLDVNQSADAVFRYTLTAGPESGLDPETPQEFLVPRPLPPPAPPEGVVMRVLNLARDNGEWLPRPKSLNYSNALLGRHELRRRAKDPSDEGLFLAREGAVIVETTHQNVAWIRDGVLCYPDPEVGSIAGTCLAWALEQGCRAAPRRAGLDELLKAEAILVLNAVRGITPVRQFRGREDEVLVDAIESRANPVVRLLQQRWTEALAATATAPIA